MKRYWTAGAVGLAAILAASGCNDYGNTFQGNTGAQLISLSPSNIPAGSGDTTITVNGGGFVAATVVEWNQQKLETHVTLDANNNVTLLTAVVKASLIAKPGKALVFTQNPFSGAGNNGLSNTITFLVNNPKNPFPAITGITTGTANGTGLPITITGTDFLNSSTDATQVSTVNFNFGGLQSNITPTMLSNITATQITTTIPNALLGTSGCANITVFNPASPPVPNLPGSVGSGGGSSNQWPIAIGSGTCPAAAAKKSATAATAQMVTEETPAVSVDGRYVGYSAEQGEQSEIFVRDTCGGAATTCQPRTLLISATPDGTVANGDSHAPSISADGRYVAFSSAATNLTGIAAASSASGRQIYLRDTCVGADASCKAATQLISTDSEGALNGSEGILPSVSSSGRFVAFLAVTQSHTANPSSGPSAAQAKSAGSANSGFRQVFVRDTCLGAANCTPKTTRISLLPGDGSDAAGKPAGPAISGDAKHVASSGAAAATLFTHSVAVDDQVFLAAIKQQ
ncbi:MAG TPA: IPT/TIG domain-containing protein [Candidatus Dormibacteraeota bacterium]|nr:IPT/TIG domain-containing protein [Candidatus Dormibacteraeota bacterium]